MKTKKPKRVPKPMPCRVFVPMLPASQTNVEDWRVYTRLLVRNGVEWGAK